MKKNISMLYQLTNIGKHISDLRTKRNMSYAELSKKSKVCFRAIKKIESGDLKCLASNIVEILKVLEEEPIL